MLLAGVSANTLVVQKCKGHTCDTPDFPILDWNPDTQSCFCRVHPCHHDDVDGKRVIHSCGTEKPHLGFDYTAEKKLGCKCTTSTFAGSVYIASELCPGHSCEDGSDLLLDYDEAEKKCVCRTH